MGTVGIANSNKMRIAIIGGGISGFSCAVRLLEHYKTAEVTVISEAFTPNTTGDGSAGLWIPYLLGNTPSEKVNMWSQGMFHFLEKLWLSEDAGEAGVCLIPVILLTTGEAIADFWKDVPYGRVPLSQRQLDQYNADRRQKKFTTGVQFVSYTSEPKKLLPYLMKRFVANGGKIIQQKVDNLDEFKQRHDYDVFINCTGLGSRKVVQDEQTYAVRGQITRVKAPWMYYATVDDTKNGNYVIPNSESVVMGCTQQKDDYSTAVSMDDKHLMVSNCKEFVPGLAHAQYLFDFVGLRPGRDELRLEAENDSKKIVIHNYGHGGSGVTLAWGCAENVLNLLQSEIKSKL